MASSKFIWLRHLFYNRMVGTLLPVKWVAPVAPAPEQLCAAAQPPTLQVVSHCWQYSHMLLFQLSSLANFPPSNHKLIYTLFYADEDTGVKHLIERFDAMQIPNIQWDWQVLTRPELFRRAIGRNKAALNSTADWLWFSDCDLIFHHGCLDSVATAIAGKRTGLVYPATEYITNLLPAEHPMLNQNTDNTLDIDTALFNINSITKAKGAFQIVHGDVARTCGYCSTASLYQQPSDMWRKTFEDSAFRKLIGYQGEPVDITGLYRIRHQEKGRYTKGTRISRVRRKLRQATDNK